MIQVNISEAKAQLSNLIAKANGGEVIIICNHNRPVAQLSSLAPPKKRVLGQRVLGDVWIADDFDAPLTDVELEEWERPIEL